MGEAGAYSLFASRGHFHQLPHIPFDKEHRSYSYGGERAEGGGGGRGEGGAMDGEKSVGGLP